VIRRVLLVSVLILALRLPFLHQAIQGDDVYYLAGAEHAQVEPLHPNHTHYIFMGDVVDMRGHPHPPLDPWILAALLGALGDVREVPFHLAYTAFSLAAALAMLSLAGRFSSKPLLATLLFCAVPAFVINGNSFEADLPFLAFWMLAVAAFVRCVDRDALWLMLVSAVCAGLAALAAYQGIFLTPILGAYLIAEKKRDIVSWIATLAAPVTLGAWQIWERASSGALPATVLAGYLSSYGLEAFQNKVRGAAALIVHLGWMVCPLILLTLIPRSGKWRWILAALSAVGAAFYDPNPLFWITFACGVWVLAFCAGRGFLGWWVLLFFAGAVAVFFAGSARYLLPIAAPVAILMANEARPGILWTGWAAGTALALALAVVNYQHWDAYRQFAGSLSSDASERRVWINGGWGLHYYLETEGALPLVKDHPVLAGEMVASSRLASPIPVGAPLTPVRELEIRPSLPLRLISLSGRPAYSTAGRGLLPFEISREPIDVVRVDIAAEPQLSWLDPKDRRTASQTLRGLFPDGWMGKDASVILKTPATPAPLRASFYIPPSARARHVRLLLGDTVVAEQSFPGPGAFELSAEVHPTARNVSVTLSVDQTFTAPPDIRELGMLVTGIGFK
jgi:Dolichyl-phosphate-mannose-protein mannosyltransferase